MTDHSSRSHAVLSASGAHRWMTCTASALLEQQFPDTTSDAAKEGTLAHELAEIKLRHYFFTLDFTKRKLNAAVKKLKEDSYWNSEMDGYTDDYLDYIKENALAFSSKPFVSIEKRVDLSTWIPDGFGTADCIMLSGNTLSVVDFKYGKGVPITAEKNPQMMIYALGAWAEYKFLYPIEHVHLAIVQPRISSEVSEWACTIDELLEFGEQVKAKAREALTEESVFTPSEDACRFCRARTVCRARADKNTKFGAFTATDPKILSNTEIGKYLALGEDVARWLKELQDYALSKCLAGEKIAGYKAVEGRGSRDWVDVDKALSAIKESGVPEELLYERKPLSLAQIEKLMGKKEFESCVGDMVIKNPGKPALVKSSDKRQAITTKITAKMAFNEEE